MDGQTALRVLRSFSLRTRTWLSDELRSEGIDRFLWVVFDDENLLAISWYPAASIARPERPAFDPALP